MDRNAYVPCAFSLLSDYSFRGYSSGPVRFVTSMDFTVSFWTSHRMSVDPSGIDFIMEKQNTHHLKLIIAGIVSMVLMLACLTGFIVSAATGNGINTNVASSDPVGAESKSAVRLMVWQQKLQWPIAPDRRPFFYSPDRPMPQKKRRYTAQKE